MKQITRILVSISILLFLFQIDGVFAATETKSTVTDAAIEILNLIVGVFNFFISPAIAAAGWLLSPDWTMGDIFGFRVVLHDMWVTISNITYFIYAIALIIMALASMFNVENYGVKKLLPRFALGIIMVPMTWWFVQATVSLANILTVSVIQIPFETLEKKGGNGDSWLSKENIPTELTYDETKVGSKFNAGDGRTSLKKIMEKPSAGPFSMLNAYAYGIFSIQDVKQITDKEKSNIKAGVNIFNKLLYGLIVYIAFGFVIIALIAALFKRAILLWVYSMFSPLFSLAFFLPDGLKKGLDLFDYKKFIGLAFVPVFVAGALAFGLVLLNLIVNPIAQGNTCTNGESYCLNNIMGDNQSKLTVKKEAGGSDNEQKVTSEWVVAGITIKHIGTINTGTNGAIEGAGQLTASIFGKILFDILGILILWMAVFGALKGSELTAKVVGSVEALGKQAGGMWKYAPIPGMPGGSVHGLNQGAQMAMNAPKKAADKRFNESSFGQTVNRMNGITPGDINSNARIKELASKIKDGSQANTTEVVNAVDGVRSASQSGLTAIANGMRDIANKLGKSEGIQDKMLEQRFLQDYGGIGDKKSLQENLKLMSEGKLDENSKQFKAITAAFAGLEKGSIDIKQAKDVLGKLDTPRGSSVDNQQSNNPPKSGNNFTININGTNIEIPKDSNGGITSAGINTVSDEINKNYKGNIGDLKTILIQQGIKENEADAIVKKVEEKKKDANK